MKLTTESRIVAMFSMIILFLFTYVQCSEKRLLFNDPQSIQTMLHQYEAQLNNYGNSLQVLENKVSALQTENTALNLEMKNATDSIKLFQNKMSALQIEKSSLHSELNNATNSIKELHGKMTVLEIEKLGLQKRINMLEDDNKQGESGESTFIRWGRKACPNDNQTELVYSGIGGGSYFDQTGSGVDYLCLPHDPDRTNTDSALVASSKVSHGLLYGGEYEMNFKNVRYNDVVPCSVCRTKGTILMIPAKLSCPTSNWKILYSGILVSNHYSFKSASSFVCMDANPEYMEGTRTHNDNGKLFSPVKAVCGSLPCPPYVNDEIVSCVVCTK